tara:strand:- start:612 stop:1319 length:708 start_codon:yes stop_codon:yes gene_type:complete
MKDIFSLNIKEFSLSNDIKYWIVYNIFDNNEIKIIENFFEKQNYNLNNNHLMENPLLLKHNYEIPYINYFKSILKNITLKYNTTLRNKDYIYTDYYKFWINSYNSFNSKKSKQNVFIPHIDDSAGIVGNYWLSKNLESSGTKLFKYNGNIYYMTDDDKSLFIYDENFDYKLFDPIIEYNKWYNIDNQILEKNNLIFQGIVPCVYNSITIYNANVPHIPFINENIVKRNSISFLLK